MAAKSTAHVAAKAARSKSIPTCGMLMCLRCTLSYLLFSLFLFFCYGCDDTPTIDLKKETPPAQQQSAENEANNRHTLNVAIGAMLSPEITREYYEELIRLIGKKIDHRVLFSQRRTYAEINQMIKKHEVDVAFVCSGPYTEGHDDFGMEILATPVVHGKTIYYSYIITAHDSDINSFSDLKGHRFAFTDPNSNTGYIVPLYMLALRGETPDSFFSDTFFTNSHDNSIKAVAEGLADGAAVDSLIWEFINQVDSSSTSKTKIIEKSEPYGIPPVVVHPNIDATLKERLRNIFLSIHKDPQAVPLLQQLQIDSFTTGDDSLYQSVRSMRETIKKTCGDRLE